MYLLSISTKFNLQKRIYDILIQEKQLIFLNVIVLL